VLIIFMFNLLGIDKCMVHAKIKPHDNSALGDAKVQMSRIEQLPVQVASKAISQNVVPVV
jgi:hypothetical protein